MRQDTPVIQGLKNLPSRENILQEAAKKIMAHPLAKHIRYPRECGELAETGKARYRTTTIRVKYELEAAGEIALLFEWPFETDGYKAGLDSETGDEYILQPAPHVRIALPTTVDVPVGQLLESLAFFKEVAEFGKALEKEMSKPSVILTKTAQERIQERESDQKAKAARIAAENSKGLRVGGTIALSTSPESLERGKTHLVTAENGRTYRVQIYTNGAVEIERQS